jgi:hypothetical protein
MLSERVDIFEFYRHEVGKSDFFSFNSLHTY